MLKLCSSTIPSTSQSFPGYLFLKSEFHCRAVVLAVSRREFLPEPRRVVISGGSCCRHDSAVTLAEDCLGSYHRLNRLSGV